MLFLLLCSIAFEDRIAFEFRFIQIFIISLLERGRAMSGVPSVKNLEGLFRPKGLAVVGASSNPEKIGYQIMYNLVEGGFSGEVYPINPKADEILGKKSYSSVKDVVGDVDLVVVAVPAPFVMATLEDCAVKGVKNVAIITSGFGEVGKKKEEQELTDFANKNGISLVGPNT